MTARAKLTVTVVAMSMLASNVERVIVQRGAADLYDADAFIGANRIAWFEMLRGDEDRVEVWVQTTAGRPVQGRCFYRQADGSCLDVELKPSSRQPPPPKTSRHSRKKGTRK